MKVAFFSNYLNHHQLPFCLAMCRLTEGNFTFVATKPVADFRKSLGYQDMDKQYPFVLTTYDDPAAREKALQLAEEADVMIIGAAPEEYVQRRMEKNKLTFRYSERLYKTGYVYALSPNGQKMMTRRHRVYKNKPLYMLCASAFTARDFAINGAYKGKTFKWGYFPETKRYPDVDAIIDQKEENSIVWVGRFIDWKHPELPVEIAKQLKREGYTFTLNMLGNGELLDTVRAKVEKEDLGDCVHVLGAKPSGEVREYMEKSQIHLFTSDRNEGWGAVLNEGMNSACTVVANHKIGAARFLVKDGENSCLYKNKKELYQKVKHLLDNPAERRTMSRKAYESITRLWNADEAAQRLLQLAEVLQTTPEAVDLWENGPCSKAFAWGNK